MRQWIIWMVIIFISAACQNQSTPAAIETPSVEIIEAPLNPTSTPDCMHAAGVTLEVRRFGDSMVVLQASGLQPREIPYVTFDTALPSRALRIEAGLFAVGADEHGNFSYEEHLSISSEGETSATWDIRFIHARGVECATITLP